jgi:anti-sigma B factor antagonist
VAPTHDRGEFSVDAQLVGDDVIVLRPRGDLDLASSPSLREQLFDELSRRPHVILDCSEITFIGSAGIQVLVDAHQHAKESDALLHVTGASSRTVARPLEITGVDRAIRVVDEPAAVLACRLAGSGCLGREVG